MRVLKSYEYGGAYKIEKLIYPKNVLPRGFVFQNAQKWQQMFSADSTAKVRQKYK